MKTTAASQRHPWHPVWWFLAILLLGFAWQGWRMHDYRCAIREARAAGFTWREGPTAWEWVRQDWRNIWEKATWAERDRALSIHTVPDLTPYRSLIHRLNPVQLFAYIPECKNLDAFKGLTALQELVIFNGSALQSVDGLSGLTGLTNLTLLDCRALQNVDALKGLIGLKQLDLTNCTDLHNVDALKRLMRLQSLNLQYCINIPASALRELRAALPKTIIFVPDPSQQPPP